ncbi:unnamed protein product [Trypanosoma congolense IL3000]|uniref:WGS project CAEQ00000000 data, annotated contig 1629 n=1 Tax=Trypanosoma congolense (strain IL3000) TaxID=1068625 RepID=F9W7M4_TRYCI|nr:unnamed protein product [Trypanosoma congolense IL3000]
MRHGPHDDCTQRYPSISFLLFVFNILKDIGFRGIFRYVCVCGPKGVVEAPRFCVTLFHTLKKKLPYITTMRFPPHNNNKNNCCYPYYYYCYFKMIPLSHCCPGGRLMNGDDEACVDLRRCWRTFMVDSADQSQRQEQGSDAKEAQHHLGHDELTLLRRYRVVGTEEDEQSLFFLSLISPNAELLRATSHLFTQLNFQFRQLAVENEGKVMLLRDYHEEQLTNLLEASNVEAGDMIVGSDITEHFVLKHQRELEELQQENCYTESVLMLELRENFFTFLKTSAHGTMDSLEHGAGWLKLRQDDEQRKHVANISSFCGPRFPVRVLELPNLLRKKLGGFRVKDPLLRPVVVDISPLANLRDCLFCLYAENQAAAQAVEEHLLRLSRQIHALLFFIGSEEEARSILTNKYAELFLTNDRRFAAKVVMSFCAVAPSSQSQN